MKVLEYFDKINIKKSIIGKNVVLAGGCFDLLHYGHIKFLEDAKKHGDFLVVALESDKSIRLKKKKKPFHNIKERAKILSAISYVDMVIKLPFFKYDSDYFKLTRLISPKIIAVTPNDPMYKNKKKQAKEVNGKIMIVTKVIKKFSSSKALKYATIFSD